MRLYSVMMGQLVARTAVHVGAGTGRETTDDLCRRDASGHFIMPGTAIAGALRSITTRLAPRMNGNGVCRALTNAGGDQPCECRVCHLFGEVNPGEGASGRASRLFVAHALARLPEHASPRIRDAVGIDRQTRTSARESAAKFDLESLPAGTVFDLRLELEDANADDERLLAVALAEWQAGRVWLGGRAARGLGAFDLQEIRLKTLDMTRDEGLLAYLKTDAPDGAASIAPDWIERRLSEARANVNGQAAAVVNDPDVPRPEAHSFFSVAFNIDCEALFLANDAVAAARAGLDHAPLLDAISRTGAPVLPGASLRGVLRAQAERIARTLATLETEGEGEAAAPSFGQICPACDPLRRPTGDEQARDIPLASCDALLKGEVPTDKEVREAQLCLACRLFGCTRRGSRLRVEDARGVEGTRKRLDFLAIDRFTGGGRDGFKFDALASWKPVFSARLHLENPTAWELGWLALALRDLAEGMVTIGFGAAKGFGRARVESLIAQHGFIGDDDFVGPPELAARAPRATSGLYRALRWRTSEAAEREELLSMARSWVEEFHVKRRGFAREERLRLTKDTYFGSSNDPTLASVSTLYDREAYRCRMN